VSNSAETCPAINRLLLTVTPRTLMLLTRWIPGRFNWRSRNRP